MIVGAAGAISGGLGTGGGLAACPITAGAGCAAAGGSAAVAAFGAGAAVDGARRAAQGIGQVYRATQSGRHEEVPAATISQPNGSRTLAKVRVRSGTSWRSSRMVYDVPAWAERCESTIGTTCTTTLRSMIASGITSVRWIPRRGYDTKDRSLDEQLTGSLSFGICNPAITFQKR